MLTLHQRLEAVFRDVFHNDELLLTNETSAADIPGWDSVAHINLMFGLEQALGVRFAGNELAECQNIGQLKQVLAAKGLS